MEVVYLVLVGMGGVLDTIELQVRDPQDCSREVQAAMAREKWVLSVGDRVEVRATPS